MQIEQQYQKSDYLREIVTVLGKMIFLLPLITFLLPNAIDSQSLPLLTLDSARSYVSRYYNLLTYDVFHSNPVTGIFQKQAPARQRRQVPDLLPIPFGGKCATEDGRPGLCGVPTACANAKNHSATACPEQGNLICCPFEDKPPVLPPAQTGMIN